MVKVFFSLTVKDSGYPKHPETLCFYSKLLLTVEQHLDLLCWPDHLYRQTRFNYLVCNGSAWVRVGHTFLTFWNLEWKCRAYQSEKDPKYLWPCVWKVKALYTQLDHRIHCRQSLHVLNMDKEEVIASNSRLSLLPVSMQLVMRSHQITHSVQKVK